MRGEVSCRLARVVACGLLAIPAACTAAAGPVPRPSSIATPSPVEIARPAHDTTPSPLEQASQPRPPGPLGQSGCQPESPTLRTSSGTEVLGTASDRDELWALTGALPLHVELDYKIIWRFTGSGPVNISTSGPGGSAAEVLFGPEYHGTNSSWRRPGIEYGMGYKFHKWGCWNFHVMSHPTATTSRSGDVWLMVLPPG